MQKLVPVQVDQKFSSDNMITSLILGKQNIQVIVNQEKLYIFVPQN